MSITTPKKYIGFLGAVLGILQGLAWAILSLMVIFLYTEVWKPDFKNELKDITYGSVLESSLYTMYINQGDDKMVEKFFEDLLLKPSVVLSVSIVYLILSLAWIASSLMVLQALRQENNSRLKVTYKSWSSVTIVTSVVDFLVLIIAIVDFNYLTTTKILLLAETLISCGGIIMTIAARGFTLWVVNVAVAVLFMRFAMAPEDVVLNNAPTHMPSQNLFSQPATPRGNVNDSFNWEGENPKYPHSKPYVAPQTYAKPEVLPKPTVKPNDHLARIGRPAPKSYAHNVPPPKVPGNSSQNVYPRVPSPDYSPPNSPYQQQLKSALKTRPQNAYGNNYN